MGAGSWAEMARLIPGRSGDQCRKRWAHHFVKKPALAAEKASSSAAARELGVPELAGKKRRRIADIPVNIPFLHVTETNPSSPPVIDIATTIISEQDELAGSLTADPEFSVFQPDQPDAIATRIILNRESTGEGVVPTGMEVERAAINTLGSHLVADILQESNIVACEINEVEEQVVNQLCTDLNLNKRIAAPRKKLKSK